VTSKSNSARKSKVCSKLTYGWRAVAIRSRRIKGLRGLAEIGVRALPPGVEGLEMLKYLLLSRPVDLMVRIALRIRRAQLIAAGLDRSQRDVNESKVWGNNYAFGATPDPSGKNLTAISPSD
jgi:hypothetical protein